jgi:HPt (histidine-containing phosphotransfer) domain-containing protein
VSAYVDLTRISELQEIMGAEGGSIVASMLSSLTGAIERLDAAVADAELDQAIQAAHAARNDALMLGAAQLQAALTDLEAAARDFDQSRTSTALERVREVWPPTRDQLAGL